MTTDTLTRIERDVNTTLDLFERLRNAKTEIALMRRQNLHLSAAILRDKLLCEVEAWIDPDGETIRMEQQTAQRAFAAASARAIDPACGF